MGVIDALNEGFRIVVQRPLLLTIPILLDVVLLVSPRPTAPELLLGVGGVDANGAEALGSLLSGLLIRALALYVPSLGVAVPVTGQLGGGIELAGMGSVIGLGLLLLLMGVVISTLWLGLLRKTIQPGVQNYDLTAMVMDRAPRLLGLTALTIAALLAVALVTALMLLFASFLAAMLGLALVAALIGIAFVMFFANLSVILDDASPRDAIQASVDFLRSNSLPVVGLVVLTFVVQFLANTVLSQLTAAVPGYLLAVGANAFLGTVMAAGSMVFYLSRTRDIEIELEAAGPDPDL
ncbi:MAG: hypothetical protein QF719_07970 [Chloroflexota bacterium]|nr:hypothetical protein [Chloroflexota bacterium]